MKKVLSLVLVGWLTGLSACLSPQTNQNDPKAVLSSFFDDIASKNFEKAGKLTTRDSEGMLRLAQAVMEHTPDSLQQECFSTKNLFLGDPVIHLPYATIAVKSPYQADSVYFSLHKNENRWEVSLNISTLYQLNRRALNRTRGNEPDSLNTLNRATLRDTSSISNEEIKKAHHKIDSLNTLLRKGP
ncbi:MAG: hypothetical protein KGM98_10910 [Bacteroidota bacterium]|nr:hypothetical protein [Bacteroidota bacterium]